MNLLVLNYEYPPLGGGAGEITRNISENISMWGHQVTVVTTWFEGLAEDEVKNNVRIIRLKSRRKAIHRSDVFEMRSWIKMSKSFLLGFCAREKFDCCFANFAIPGGATALYLKRELGIPYTIISHGHDIPWLFKKEMFFYHLLTFFRIHRICRSSSVNFVQTEEMKRNIDHFLSGKSPEKNVLIPNGIDKKTFCPDAAKRTERMRILFCGRLVGQKDPFTFLRAVRMLQQDGLENFEIVISGDGPLRTKMEQFVAENKLSPRITFTGWITREVLLTEYQKANIFVQTSKYEAMSMAVMEALACGSFVICTHAGSNDSMVQDGENGFLFEAGNAIMLSGKIKAALEKFSSDKKYVASADTVSEWKDLAKQYLSYFSKVLS
jgi:glycosyltransferase involved in cell wall biosynthesis